MQVPLPGKNLPALVCGPLQPFADHVFTTSAWSINPWGGHTDPPPDDLADAVRVPPSRLIRVHQVHGREVLIHRAGQPPPGELPDADVIVSDDPSVALAVQTADCVPLLVADRRTGAVAVAHAGWRGLAAGVPGVAVEALVREFGSRTGDLVAAVGPAIGPCCYEVGADVRTSVEAAGFPVEQIRGWFHDRPRAIPENASMERTPKAGRPGHWFFDTWRATRDQLRSAGVPAGQIHTADLCTASHDRVFCSYRRDGKGAGRIAGAIRRQERL